MNDAPRRFCCSITITALWTALALMLGDPDSAPQALRDGYAATGDARLQARIDELTAPVSTPTPTPMPTPEPAPTPKPDPDFTINSATSIGEAAFVGCTSLTDVFYTGSEGQWGQIADEVGNDRLLDATIHYNS